MLEKEYFSEKKKKKKIILYFKLIVLKLVLIYASKTETDMSWSLGCSACFARFPNMKNEKRFHSEYLKSVCCRPTCWKGYWALPYSRVSSPSTSRSASLSRHSLEVVLTRSAPEETRKPTVLVFLCKEVACGRKKKTAEPLLYIRSYSGGFWSHNMFSCLSLSLCDRSAGHSFRRKLFLLS